MSDSTINPDKVERVIRALLDQAAFTERDLSFTCARAPAPELHP